MFCSKAIPTKLRVQNEFFSHWNLSFIAEHFLFLYFSQLFLLHFIFLTLFIFFILKHSFISFSHIFFSYSYNSDSYFMRLKLFFLSSQHSLFLFSFLTRYIPSISLYLYNVSALKSTFVYSVCIWFNARRKKMSSIFFLWKPTNQELK